MRHDGPEKCLWRRHAKRLHGFQRGEEADVYQSRWKQSAIQVWLVSKKEDSILFLKRTISLLIGGIFLFCLFVCFASGADPLAMI